MAFSAKNKQGFIDGSIVKPATISPDYPFWIRCNHMVLSWILNAITLDLANSVLYAESTREVWSDLKERFSQSNGLRIFQIKRSISSHFQEQTSIVAYSNKLKGYWDELASYISLPTCSCGALKALSDHEQRERVFQFLMGLNDSYAAIGGQILLMDPLPPLNKAYSLVLQEEKQHEITASIPTTEAAALIANAVTRSSSIGTRNNRKECSTCEHCGLVGHIKARCYKLIGYPLGHRLHKSG
ncbi:uncharacterized protein LOC143883120 [Tasmannia lanceolata]|uniref:uncharacterized protein LOC143883120 n=1 Tax=Tasmannia lanceolata TaxID=3420 RepID=UPI0040642CD9